MPDRKLNTRQSQFVVEYLVDGNATQAAIRAGYSEKTAYAQGSRLLKSVEVQKSIERSRRKALEKAEVTREWILTRLVENLNNCLDKDSHTYNPSAANKAIELLGREHKMFIERKELAGANGGPLQHEVTSKDVAKDITDIFGEPADGDGADPASRDHPLH